LSGIQKDCHELTIKKEFLQRKGNPQRPLQKPVAPLVPESAADALKIDKNSNKALVLEKRESFAIRKNSADTHSTFYTMVDNKRTKQN